MNNRKEITTVFFVAIGAIFWGAAGAAFLAVLQSLTSGYCLFSLAAVIGFLLLLVDGVWFYQFKSWASRIHKARISAPHKCPSCGADIKLSEIPKASNLGFPQSDLAMDCPSCQLRLDISPPYSHWLITVRNPEKNPKFSFLYNGELLADSEIHEISRGRHTRKAYEKLRSRSLALVAGGNFDELRNFAPPMVHASASVQVDLLPIKADGLPGERSLVSFNPVTLLEQRTHQGSPVWAPITRGSLTLTTQRFLFDGWEKDVEKRLVDIESFQLERGDLLIRRKGKKRPEKFSGVDALLAAAILTGTRR